MSMQITLTLPDDTYRRAAYLAHLTGRDIADVLAETIDISLQPLGVHLFSDQLVVDLSDQEVLTIADSQMNSVQDGQLSELLEKQQAGTLDQEAKVELLALMQIYQEGLLRKAQALHEAVKRGLRGPLEP